ncbi:MAG: cation-efflux pump [Pseudolabrys sp.]|nr:cation-efflux pump [Pseudolabrys sp.]
MQSEKEQVALTSIAASAAMTVAKGIVGLLTGSLGLLSEAGHSLIDLGATIMTYVAVRVSGKPADAEHHYGHGKIESISALAETAMLFLLSGVVIWEACKRLFAHEGHGHAVDPTVWAFAVIVASIVIDFFRARALTHTAEKTSSHALEADALHFSSDLWSSFAVLIGLGGVWFGLSWADSAAAVVVAMLVCIAGWRLGKRTIDTLTDVAPKGIVEHVTSIAQRVPGVVSVDQIRAREVGDTTFVDLAVTVSRTLPLERVNELKKQAVHAIGRALSNAQVTVTTEAVALSDETVLERVMVIARNRALAVHHVTVHKMRDRLLISLDLEVDGRLPLGEAHRVADELEHAIEQELGAEVEVETHIEPLQPENAQGREAPPERINAVTIALSESAAEGRTIRDIHDVRVRETDEGEIVNFHCRVDPALSVQDVHEKVDEIERALRRKSPSVKRVIGHAEPIR